MLSNRYLLGFFIVTFLFISFNNNQYFLTIPKGFPNLQIPEDNKLTSERIYLGKKLFFDNILSRDSSISCASCHKPDHAFTDGLKKAVGIKNRSVTRNTPTLTNIAYNKNFLRDGVNPSLETQVLVPIHEKNEFDFHILLAAERLKKKPSYVQLFEKAYGGIPTPKLITKAIASYERTLISGNSRYDQYIYQNKKYALSSSEKKGLKLFNKLYCVSCHSGFNFSNGEIVNNGLYEKYEDVGKMRVSLKEIDNGCFKVPTLRNIALTAPYMHDGSIQTLEEVIDHYMKGGSSHPSKHPFIKPFSLDNSDRKNLVLFLKSLTDSSFAAIQ
tara:strand:+ start:167 stop:1150 length:984 start_codon:yes stop_codon:yes gene_type:complete